MVVWGAVAHVSQAQFEIVVGGVGDWVGERLLEQGDGAGAIDGDITGADTEAEQVGEAHIADGLVWQVADDLGKDLLAVSMAAGEETELSEVGAKGGAKGIGLVGGTARGRDGTGWRRRWRNGCRGGRRWRAPRRSPGSSRTEGER